MTRPRANTSARKVAEVAQLKAGMDAATAEQQWMAAEQERLAAALAAAEADRDAAMQVRDIQ